MNIFTKTKSWKDYMEKATQTNIPIADEKTKEILNFLNINEDTLTLVKEAAEILFPYKEEISDLWFGYVASIEKLVQTVLEHSNMDKIKKIFDQYLRSILSCGIKSRVHPIQNKDRTSTLSNSYAD